VAGERLSEGGGGRAGAGAGDGAVLGGIDGIGGGGSSGSLSLTGAEQAHVNGVDEERELFNAALQIAGLALLGRGALHC
jgi:hypothetical protein